MGAYILLLTIPEGGKARESVCLPAPGWALLSSLHQPGSFLDPHQCGREPHISSAHTSPSPQDNPPKTIAQLDQTCLIRADQSPGSLLTDRFQRNPLECFCLEEKVGRGHRSFSFHTHPRTTVTRLISYLIGRILFKETSPVSLPNTQ